MKITLVFLIFTVILFSGCSKSSDGNCVNKSKTECQDVLLTIDD